MPEDREAAVKSSGEVPGGTAAKADGRPEASGLRARLRRHWTEMSPFARFLRWRGQAKGEGGEVGDKDPWAKRWASRLADFRSILTSAVALPVLGTVVVIVLLELPGRALVIDPIDAPKALVAEGYSPTVISNRLMDRMVEIRDLATTQQDRIQVAPDWTQLGVEVPGTGMSVKTVLRLVKSLLGIREDRIGGEVVGKEQDLRLRLRLQGRGRINEISAQSGSGVDLLVDLGAQAILKAVNPCIIASYKVAQDEHDEALEAIERCLTNDTKEDDAWAYNQWGRVLAQRCELAAAIDKYRLAMMDSDDLTLMSLYNWGVALWRAGDLEGAEAKLREAVARDDGFAAAYSNLGLIQLERYDPADIFRPCAPPGSAPSDLDSARDEAAQAALLDEAEANFRAAREKRPNEPSHSWNLAAVLEKKAALLGPRAAPLETKEAADLETDEAALLEAWRDYSRGAVAMYRAALLVDPHHQQSYRDLGTLLFNCGDYEMAADRFRTAVRLEPGDAETRFKLGYALELLGDYADKDVASRPGVRCGLEPPTVVSRISKQQRYRAAAEQFTEVIALDQGYGDARRRLARVLEKADDRDGAVEAYRALAALELDRIGDWHELARLFELTGDRHGRAEALRQVVALDPKDRDSAWRLADLLQSLEDYAGEVEARALVIGIDPENDGARFNHAAALMRAERPAAAVKAFEDAEAVMQPHPVVLYNWGLALAALGRKTEAIQKGQEALELQMEPQVRKALEGWVADLKVAVAAETREPVTSDN